MSQIVTSKGKRRTMTKKKTAVQLVRSGEIESLVHVIRGQRVILDAELPQNAPLMLEHLATADQYADAREYILETGRKAGLSFG